MRIAFLLLLVQPLAPAHSDDGGGELPRLAPIETSIPLSMPLIGSPLQRTSVSWRTDPVVPTGPSSASNRRTGAALGFVVGGSGTYLALRSGGSTGMCNHAENQDAIRKSECVGLAALGGLVGAGAGAWLGGRIGNREGGGAELDRLDLVPISQQGRYGVRLGARIAF